MLTGSRDLGARSTAMTTDSVISTALVPGPASGAIVLDTTATTIASVAIPAMEKPMTDPAGLLGRVIRTSGRDIAEGMDTIDSPDPKKRA